MLTIILCLFYFNSPTYGQTILNLGSQSTIDFISQIEKYINSLQIITGEFNQVSSNGATDSGIFYIKKPGKMRLEYASPMLLVADGDSIVYQDKKLDQISYISIDSNPASMILNKEIKLSGVNPNVAIKEIISQPNNKTYVTLSTPNEKHSGTMTLIFETLPLSLIGWQVTDPQGITTNITLSNITPQKYLDDSLFKITRGKSIGSQKSKSKYY